MVSIEIDRDWVLRYLSLIMVKEMVTSIAEDVSVLGSGLC